MYRSFCQLISDRECVRPSVRPVVRLFMARSQQCGQKRRTNQTEQQEGTTRRNIQKEQPYGTTRQNNQKEHLDETTRRNNHMEQPEETTRRNNQTEQPDVVVVLTNGDANRKNSKEMSLPPVTKLMGAEGIHNGGLMVLEAALEASLPKAFASLPRVFPSLPRAFPSLPRVFPSYPRDLSSLPEPSPLFKGPK